MSAFKQWGVLLVNLGTPDAPEVAPVRRYLREFLSDPRVLDINPVGRWLLLNLVILRRRPKQSAAAYAKVWTERGSPLLFHTQDLAAGVRQAMDLPVAIGMRYQSPSIRSGLLELRDAGADRVVVLPLFPQYSSAAWGSAVEKVWAEAASLWNVPSISVVPPFFDDPGYIRAMAEVARPVLAELEPDAVLMSFHGLPERHCTKSDLGSHCLRRHDCCDALVAANRYCYRAQCFATARLLSAELGLSDATVTFQSRLGRDPWIQPFTDEMVVSLAASAVKRIAVFSPAFVADCLETLEEIQIGLAEEFEARLGERLVLVPSLNSSPAWVSAVVDLIRDAVGTA